MFLRTLGELYRIISTPLPLLTSLNSTIELKDNTVIIVLGASGDLAKKKTVSLPSCFLYQSN